MSFHRNVVASMIMTALILLPSVGTAGPIFDRVTKTGTMRVGIPFNFTPQGFLKPNGDWVGFEVDLASELAKHMNLKLERVKVSERTWGPMLAQGNIDAAFCRIRHTRSLDREFDFSVAYFHDLQQILTLKGSFKIAADLKGHKIAAVQGTSSEKAAMYFLRKMGDDNAETNVISFPDAPSCFMALGRSKVSGWMDSGLALLEYASRHTGRFELIAASDSAEALAIALPSDDSAWRDQINFTIQDMAVDGSLDKIYDQWFGPQVAYPFPRKRPVEIWPE